MQSSLHQEVAERALKSQAEVVEGSFFVERLSCLKIDMAMENPQFSYKEIHLLSGGCSIVMLVFGWGLEIDMSL